MGGVKQYAPHLGIEVWCSVSDLLKAYGSVVDPELCGQVESGSRMIVTDPDLTF